MHTLITFLGKGGQRGTGYREATYRFADGSTARTPYFGLALAAQLNPDRIVVLGTASSMWDVFVEHLAPDEGQEALRLALMERVESGTVDEELLAEVASLLAAAIGKPVEPHLIGMAREAAEQDAILDTIARVVPRGTVSIDLTHGFRHLGMLGFVSGFMLERLLRGVAMAGLWYGALDMTTDGITPVLRLDGLADIQRWTDALGRFEANGNYGVFAPLLERDGMPADKAAALGDAAFREGTMDVAGARDKLRTVLKALEAPLAGASTLFQDKLRRHLRWAREESLAECQRMLAMRALSRSDYLRAALLGIECLITRHCDEQGVDHRDHASREAVRQQLATDDVATWQRDAYRALNALRNAMAHGLMGDRKLKDERGKWRSLSQVLRDPSALHRLLEASLNRLVNSKPPGSAAAASTPVAAAASPFTALGALRDGPE